VAVALSGGIDSSAVIAAATDVVGADQIHAFTYEFDDPTHGTETHHARRVCRKLGIRRHEIFSISRRRFLDGIPEMVWRTESSVHWPKAFLLPATRHIASRGYDRYLTGFGIGSHMAYMRELSALLRWLPLPSRSLRFWKLARTGNRAWFERLARIHPGLEPPHPRLYLLLLRWLEEEGTIRDVRDFYPSELHPLLAKTMPLRELEPGLAALTRLRRLQLTAFSHLVSCVDVTRSEKAMREVGLYRVSPAHYAETIPYAYFPFEPPPRVWDPARLQRPGKLLLQRAYSGVLPDENLYRKKSWSDAVVSPDWLKQGRVLMLQVLQRFPDDMAALGPQYPDIVRELEPTSIHANCLSFWFWRYLFFERAIDGTPPSWRSLLRRDPLGDAGVR
ncbi:MAG: asparagine synthase-related protein, partial [Myxococcota bacterium]